MSVHSEMTLQPIKVIGIATRTSNQSGQAVQDMGYLWSRFYLENILSKIPNKQSQDVHVIYTDYEKDHTSPYTAIIGCRVESLDHIPEGLTGRTIPGGKYRLYSSEGKLPDIVIQQWQTIWKSNIDRCYTADLEIYHPASTSQHATVSIWIAVR